MTMNVKIEKEYDDSYQAKIVAVDNHSGREVRSTLATLKRKGEVCSACCTTTRSIEIVEEPLTE